jgi:SanA protein
MRKINSNLWRSFMKKVLIYGIIIIAILMIIVLGINLYVKASTNKQILGENDYTKLSDIDCIIILGAGVWGDKPSPILEDRLLEGIKLYQNNVSDKIIMSGDHGRESYDEVNIMKNYAIEKGIPSENIFMDHAGFSTYESIYRARDIFKAKKIVIVTQKYHLYRALYAANCLGLEAYGVGADPRQYSGATFRELREILARDKDFIKCIFKPKPTYLGDTIPVSGNGDVTNDDKKDI